MSKTSSSLLCMHALLYCGTWDESHSVIRNLLDIAVEKGCALLLLPVGVLCDVVSLIPEHKKNEKEGGV